MPIGPILAGIGTAAAAAQPFISSAFNAWQAHKQEEFQREMSNTAHQREVRDLKAAGLNPILSVKHGGASSPPGDSARADSTSIASALQARSQIELQKAQIEDTNSARALKDAQAIDINNTQLPRIDLMIAQKEQTLAQTVKTADEREKILQEIQNLKQQKALLMVNTESSALDLAQKKVQKSLYKIPAAGIDYIEKKLPEWKKRMEFKKPSQQESMDRVRKNKFERR